MDSKLLSAVFNFGRWERLVDRAFEKGLDIGLLRKMCDPNNRLQLYQAIISEKIDFMPPHMAQIPKDTPGEFRTVFVGEGVDRIIQSIINDCLFELFPDMIHPSCKSYQTGLGTGKTVKQCSEAVSKCGQGVVGIKSDFSKYFDRVSIESIMKVFDRMEDRLGFDRGTEPVINLLRRTWSNNQVFDLDGNLIEQYCGIRQGNAVGSFLADCILYELDDFMTKKYPFYVRYSDDCVTIGNPDEIVSDMNRIIIKYGISLNPKKIEYLYSDKWFKFLGFNICGSNISFSRKAIKKFEEEISNRTKDYSAKTATRNVVRFLYSGEYPWATRFLPIINVPQDIQTLNAFVMDAIRATESKNKKIGGLGENKQQKVGVVCRGTGKNVTSNRKKWEQNHGGDAIDGYISIMAMRNAMLSGQSVYQALLASVLV